MPISGPFQSQDLDFIIVRENTEGLYSGLEEVGVEESRTLRVITRAGSERIAEIACDLAIARRKLTIIHKSNVLRSDRLFLETCRAVAARRGVLCEDMLVDAAAYNLVVNPKRFDVLVTTNLFGDILSDEAAGVIGSLGLCASANLGVISCPFRAHSRQRAGHRGKGHRQSRGSHQKRGHDDGVAGRAGEGTPHRSSGAKGAGRRSAHAGSGRGLWTIRQWQPAPWIRQS